MARPNNVWQFQNFPSGPDWFVRFHDFDNEDDIANYTVTAIASGSGAVTVDERFGVYRISANAASEDSGAQIQGDMEAVSLVQGKVTEFITRVKPSVADQSTVFAGLAITDTSILHATNGALASMLTITDGVGFAKPDGESSLYGCIVRDSVLAVTGPLVTWEAAAYSVLSCRVTMDDTVAGKGRADYYVNGVHVGTLNSTTMPYDSEEILTQSIAYQSGDATGTDTFDIDYVGVRQER
jgi:hypothetical protein